MHNRLLTAVLQAEFHKFFLLSQGLTQTLLFLDLFLLEIRAIITAATACS